MSQLSQTQNWSPILDIEHSIFDHIMPLPLLIRAWTTLYLQDGRQSALAIAR